MAMIIYCHVMFQTKNGFFCLCFGIHISLPIKIFYATLLFLQVGDVKSVPKKIKFSQD